MSTIFQIYDGYYGVKAGNEPTPPDVLKRMNDAYEKAMSIPESSIKIVEDNGQSLQDQEIPAVGSHGQ